ncbi:hypothetical protein VTL71DRAFT_7357 [Oculimacula yallundae]|uniref:Uncharacterized protein n=1 Tax=Oculimacula yallundae TaxID=86028 RepID=A0ABR4BWF7_9HELO
MFQDQRSNNPQLLHSSIFHLVPFLFDDIVAFTHHTRCLLVHLTTSDYYRVTRLNVAENPPSFLASRIILLSPFPGPITINSTTLFVTAELQKYLIHD